MAAPNEPTKAPSARLPACRPPDVKWCCRTPGAPRDGAKGAGSRAARDATTTPQEEQWRRSGREKEERVWRQKAKGEGAAVAEPTPLWASQAVRDSSLSSLLSSLSLLTGLTLEGRRALIYGHICTQFIRASPSSKNHIL